MKIPGEVLYILDTLEAAGHEAYIVGGCVRDSLLGKYPTDWDICTAALPEQTKECFREQRIIETGLEHGTVTLVLNHVPYEITAYRADGKYTDGRRPDTVRFITSLKDDLSRRDFTINAMAYNPQKGFADFFDGAGDLDKGIIRCVGDPEKRLSEDALRIMRALRFACVFGFSIEENTARAMRDNAKLLGNIAAERIAVELNKMIVGNPGVLAAHLPILTEIIPELAETQGLEKVVSSLEFAPAEAAVRLAMLLRGVGAEPRGSSETALEILQRLKYDNNTIETVTRLVLYEGADIQPDGANIKRWLNKIGEERLRQIVAIKKADAAANELFSPEKDLDTLNEISALTDEIIGQKQCFSLKALAVNGKDLMAAGLTEGAEIGRVLNRLVSLVIDGQVENERTALLRRFEELRK